MGSLIGEARSGPPKIEWMITPGRARACDSPGRVHRGCIRVSWRRRRACGGSWSRRSWPPPARPGSRVRAGGPRGWSPQRRVQLDDVVCGSHRKRAGDRVRRRQEPRDGCSGRYSSAQSLRSRRRQSRLRWNTAAWADLAAAQVPPPVAFVPLAPVAVGDLREQGLEPGQGVVSGPGRAVAAGQAGARRGSPGTRRTRSQPDDASLAALSAWFGLNPDEFPAVPKSNPEPVAMLSGRLRADSNPDEDGADALEAIITVADNRLK